MGQSLRINGDMALYPGNLFTRIVSFFLSSISVGSTLRINDAIACRNAASLFLSGRANLLFLKRGRANLSARRPESRSIVQNSNRRFSILENRQAAFSTGIRS